MRRVKAGAWILTSDSKKKFEVIADKVEELENSKTKTTLVHNNALKVKCSIKYCEASAVVSVYPLWLDVHYCEKHGELIKAVFKGNSSVTKCLNDILHNVFVLKRFIEQQDGKSFTGFELFNCFLEKNPNYEGNLSCEVYFKNCLRKLNVPCAVKGDGTLALIYSCVSPCELLDKQLERDWGKTF